MSTISQLIRISVFFLMVQLSSSTKCWAQSDETTGPQVPEAGRIVASRDAPATPQVPAVITVKVYIGQSTAISFVGAIKSISSADTSVCEVLQLGEESETNIAVLTGQKAGRTVVMAALETLADPVIYTVQVQYDPGFFAELEQNINSTLPGSEVSLSIIPESDKIIVSGLVNDSKSVKDILHIIAGAQVTSDQIINRLKVKCRCCKCCRDNGFRH